MLMDNSIILILFLCLCNFILALINLLRIEKPPIVFYPEQGSVAQTKQKPEPKPYKEQDIYESLRIDNEDVIPVIQTLPEEDRQ